MVVLKLHRSSMGTLKARYLPVAVEVVDVGFHFFFFLWGMEAPLSSFAALLAVSGR